MLATSLLCLCLLSILSLGVLPQVFVPPTNLYVYDALTQYVFSYNYTLPVLLSDTIINEPVIDFSDPSFQPLGLSTNSAPLLVGLQFHFPFFGEGLIQLSVAPWGALIIHASDVCLNAGPSVYYNTSYGCVFDLIAAYMTDIDSVDSNPSQYAYISRTNVFVVRYSYLHLAAAPQVNATVSFSVAIYPSGRIIITHQQIVLPSLIATIPGLPYTRRVLIGVVTAPVMTTDLFLVNPSPLTLSSEVDSVQGLFALGVEQEWHNTSTSGGIFPPVLTITPQNNQLHLFPFPINMCLTPTYGTAAGGQLLHLHLSLVTYDLPELNLFCVFDGLIIRNYFAQYNSTYGSLDCITPGGMPGASVLVGLYNPATQQYITSNVAYYTYLGPWSPLVQPDIYMLQYNSTNICATCYVPDLLINTYFCSTDCAGVFRGKAYFDDCGSCVGGTTRFLPGYEKDCYGTCFGVYFPVQVVINNVSFTQCRCDGRLQSCTGNRGIQKLYPIPTQDSQYIDVHAFTTLPDGAGFNLQPAVSILSELDTALLNMTDPDLLVPIDLSWPFTYYNTEYTRVYVSNNGGIYFTLTTAACLQNGSQSLFTNDLSCFHSLIAASFTWYNPVQDNTITSSVSYQLTETELMVLWLNLNPVNTTLYNSFSITLQANNGILIQYWTNTAWHVMQWLVGVRLGLMNAVLMPFPYFLTGASYSQTCGSYRCNYSHQPRTLISVNELHYLPYTTFASGYYPDPSFFNHTISGQLIYCPLSITSCLSPTTGNVHGNTLVTIYNAATMSCLTHDCCHAQLNLECSFGGIYTPAVYNSQVNGYQCYSPPGAAYTVVAVSLTQGGRVIGSLTPLLFTYSPSPDVQLHTQADRDIRTCLDCSSVLITYCWKDCTGTYQGNATLDECGVCEPPSNTTAVVLDTYVATVSNYPYQSVLDCNQICYGPFISYTSGSRTNLTQHLPSFPSPVTLPQCGCTTYPVPTPLMSFSFEFTTLCNVWALTNGQSLMLQTLSPLSSYQLFVLACVCLLLLFITVQQLYVCYTLLRRRLRMTPAELAREKRRRERRRRRRIEMREIRRALERGEMPPDGLDTQTNTRHAHRRLPPGVAATAVSMAPLPPELAAESETPPITLTVHPDKPADSTNTQPTQSIAIDGDSVLTTVSPSHSSSVATAASSGQPPQSSPESTTADSSPSTIHSIV